MRYVAKLPIICSQANYLKIQDVLRKYGFNVPWSDDLEITFEKDDPTLYAVSEELRGLGYHPVPHYEPAFEDWEVLQAELLRLYISALCGSGFREWAEECGVSREERVMDKSEMGTQDIAWTYAWEAVISERLRSILTQEELAGWQTVPVRHKDPKRDKWPPAYELVVTNKLPPLAPETELHYEKHDVPRWGEDHPLYGTVGIFQRGPLRYRRADLRNLADFNRTHELFGEATAAHPLIVISQRAWQVFEKHRVGKVDVEPVEILE
jgi:hypothetical protein